MAAHAPMWPRAQYQQTVKRNVTFRRVTVDGSVLRIYEAHNIHVKENPKTGRCVVPVLMQEGTGTVRLWRQGDELFVDVYRHEEEPT